MKPIMVNLISPMEAMITPRTMKEMFPSKLSFTGAMPMAQVASSVATELVA